jgi:replicative DNA helicase
LRVLTVPKPYNDVADVILTQGEDMARETIMGIQMSTRRITKGVEVPILSAQDMYRMYVKRVMASKDGAGVDLSRWLPSLRESIRPLMAGDLAVILADTGAGKTTMLANIAYSQSPLPVLLFELELQPEDMCERFLAMNAERSGKAINCDVEQGKTFDVSRWGNIYVCPNSKVSVEDMEEIINTSELYIGQRPALVLVDYIGLMSGGQGKRYERMSTIAEGLKVMAKSTNTVVLLSSQIHRDKERKGINLHDAKDSGSIESSAQLVIGAVRTDPGSIDLTVLKCTKSLAGKVIKCTFNGDTQRIREIAR